MRKTFAILCILAFLLISCASPVPETTNTPAPTSTETLTPTIAPTEAQTTITIAAPTLSAPAEIEVGKPLPYVDLKVAPRYVPNESEAIRDTELQAAILRRLGLVPLTAGGVPGYEKDGKQYMPVLDKISGPGLMELERGEMSQDGVVTYTSADGRVHEQHLLAIDCPEAEACFEAISYNEGDKSLLYLVRVNKETGEIVARVLTGDAGSAVAQGKEIPWEMGASEHWQMVVTGDAALQRMDDVQAYSYQNGELKFEDNLGTTHTVESKDIWYYPGFGGVADDGELGLVYWDSDLGEWQSVAQAASVGIRNLTNGEVVYQIGDRYAIATDKLFMWADIRDENGKTFAYTSDGKKMFWGEGGWITLPDYGVIDPLIRDKVEAVGFAPPREFTSHGIELSPQYYDTFVGHIAGTDISIPFAVATEVGIARGEYKITGIGMTQEMADNVAWFHIVKMWMHYREFGNPDDRQITLEQYMNLLEMGRGGFDIPQYNPATGKFDQMATVNPLAGFVTAISDNSYGELPLNSSALLVVDEYGRVWSAQNDLEYIIKFRSDPKSEGYMDDPILRKAQLGYSLIMGGSWKIGASSNDCLNKAQLSNRCILQVSEIEGKYDDPYLHDFAQMLIGWQKRHEAGGVEEPPLFVKYDE